MTNLRCLGMTRYNMLQYPLLAGLTLSTQLQIIVCANRAAGINFEHTGVDGHTVLRFAAGAFPVL